MAHPMWMGTVVSSGAHLPRRPSALAVGRTPLGAARAWPPVGCARLYGLLCAVARSAAHLRQVKSVAGRGFAVARVGPYVCLAVSFGRVSTACTAASITAETRSY